MIISFLKKYILVVNIILFAVLAYVLAQIVNDKIGERLSPPYDTTASPASSDSTAENSDEKSIVLSSRKSYDVIQERNIFGLQSTSSAPELNPDEVPQTTLNLELLGTVMKPAKRASAVIKNVDTGKIRSYAEGEIIDIIESEDVELSRIGSCVVLLERSEGPETIRCKKDLGSGFSTTLTSSRINQSGFSDAIDDLTSGQISEGINEVREGVYEVDKDVLNELLSDPNQFVNQARVIPQEDGLRFFAIRPSSVFFKIGIRNGDTLHRINDVELDNVENALRLFEELRGQASFSVEFSRRGQSLTYEYMVK